MSWIHSLFAKSDRPRVAPLPAAAETAPETATGTFITEQSLVTFAGATFVSSMVSGVLLKLLPGLDHTYSAAIVAFLVGVLVFLITFTDERVQRKLDTPRAKVIAIAVGAINSIYLMAIALGVFETVQTAISHIGP